LFFIVKNSFSGALIVAACICFIVFFLFFSFDTFTMFFVFPLFVTGFFFFGFVQKTPQLNKISEKINGVIFVRPKPENKIFI